MTKIDIISGFLGAGKTTLINKLIREVYSQEQVVLIENEFGEIGVDSGFLQGSGIQIREMNSGCICCSLVGDFEKSLKEVIETYHPDRILIEPSGVGMLSDVIKAVKKLENTQDICLNSYTTVVDVKKCKLYMKNFGEFFNDQIKSAGAIILSRTDKAAAEEITNCVDMIRKLNEKAPVITTPIETLAGGVITETMEQERSLEEELMEQTACPVCGEQHHEHHHADEVFTSWGTETVKSYAKEELTPILESLDQSDLYGVVLRAKGIVKDTKGGWIHFDMVPGEYDVREGNADYTGRICVIGSDLQEDKLKGLFDSEQKDGGK